MFGTVSVECDRGWDESILSLVLGIVNSANGGCLIDEIENGIYYRWQSELWKMSGMLAEQLNVQVFAMTHSLDCIRSFADVLGKQDALLIRLEKRAKGLTAVCYSGEELRTAMDNDIELRGVWGMGFVNIDCWLRVRMNSMWFGIWRGDCG